MESDRIRITETMSKQFCCDPYNRHKTRLSTRLTPVSELLVVRVNDSRLKRGDYICVTCEIKLTEDPKSLPIREAIQSSSSPASGTVEDDIVSAGSVAAVESSESDPERSRLEADILMSILGVSPLAGTSKFYSLE